MTGDASTLTCDVCVIGGGPAGASTALRLARLEYDVIVVERSAFPRHKIGESLPPSILPVLETLGLKDAVEDAGFLRPRAAIVRWAGATSRRDYGPDTAGFQVDRGRFDALILNAAKSAGARVMQPARALRPCRSDEGWRVPVRGVDGNSSIFARAMVDASGKRVGAQKRTGPETAAIYAYWETPKEYGPETLVEAGRDRWYWGAPLPDGRFNAAVFVETARCAGQHSAGREAFYAGLLRQSRLVSACLQGHRISPIRVCSAGSLAHPAPIAGNFIRVGEASVAIDPLSSQGVQSAMASAVQASIVLNTLLRSPEHTELARNFYLARQQDASNLHVSQSSRHYARQAIHSGDAFWLARSKGPPTSAETPQPSPGQLGAHVKVQLSSKACVKQTPIVSGDVILPGQGVTHPCLERPVAFLNGVPIAALLSKASLDKPASELHEDWSVKFGPERATSILNWLWERQILVARE